MKRTWLPNLLLFSFLIISCASPLVSYRKALKNAPYDVIIVPGIPYQKQNWANNIMRSRMLWSFFLYSRGVTRHIIYSGNAVYTPYVEGKIMALHAIALGIPADSVFSETTAQHSTENLVYSYRMAKNMGFKKIGLATDPMQSKLLKTYAWDYGIPVVFIPIVYDSLTALKVDSTINIDPSGAYIKDFIPLPKRENMIKRLMGTLGLEITR